MSFEVYTNHIMNPFRWGYDVFSEEENQYFPDLKRELPLIEKIGTIALGIVCTLGALFAGIQIGVSLGFGLTALYFSTLYLKRQRQLKELQQGLKAWMDDPSATGNKEEAVKRIEDVFRYDRDRLILNDLDLNQLPSFVDILSSIKHLSLKNNKLTSLPKEICSLKSLVTLSLSENQLRELPKEIKYLSNLDTLILHNNLLESLPLEIGGLTNLTFLNLAENVLISLPTEMGQLNKLGHLALSSNPLLSELPLCLGQIPALTHLDVENTAIDQEAANQILLQSQLLKFTEAVAILPHRLETWRSLAKTDRDLSEILELNDKQRFDINLWLSRLEKTKDFSHAQSKLANIVCQILVGVVKNEAFKDLFFNQIQANNEDCQDRAAMALNEIYSSWNILCLSPDASLQEKLEIMTGVAKVDALRKAIANCIKKHGETMAESVETYLYYERKLKNRLELCTAIENMAFATIGERFWIDENSLIATVEDTYFKCLYHLPVFEKLIATEESLEPSLYKIDEESYEHLGQLGARPEGDEYAKEVLDFDHRHGEIMQLREQARLKCIQKWYFEKMAESYVSLNQNFKK